MALNEVIADLEASDDSRVADAGSMSLRLETLGETALLNGDIPMEVIDLLNQARQKLNEITEPSPYSSYTAPVLPRGRPKFDITEDQLRFFKGILFLYSRLILYLECSGFDLILQVLKCRFVLSYELSCFVSFSLLQTTNLVIEI